MPHERLSPRQMERYQAHLSLPGFGTAGQARLLAARVLLVGVGGLGCPAALYLAAAGVGRLTLVDDDTVDTTNLQRQVLYAEADQGQPKVDAAARRLRAQNADVAVETRCERLTAANVRGIVQGHDVVIDGSDNFATRYVLNDGCVLERVPLVSGSLYQYEGQVTVINPPGTPCYRCVFPQPPLEQGACHEVGALGSLAGIVGAIQAAEAIKLIVDEATSMMGRLLLIDARAMSFRQVQLRSDPDCPLCGTTPSIHDPTALTTHGTAVR